MILSLLLLCIKDDIVNMGENNKHIHRSYYKGEKEGNLMNDVEFSFNNQNKTLSINGNDTIIKEELDSYLKAQQINVSDVDSIIIWENINKIGDNCFANYSKMRTIILPESLRQIGSSSFINCVLIQEIDIPKGVEAISKNAFEGCTGLYKVLIPDSVKEILSGAFKGCTNITAIVLPESITVISNNCFEDCTNLLNAPLTPKVQSIQAEAFKNCEKIVSILIPGSVVDICESAFEGCLELNGITVDPTNKCYSSDTNRALYNFNKTRLILCPPKVAHNFVIPPSVVEFNKAAFQSCSSKFIVEFDKSSSSVISIVPDYLFAMTGLESIDIPDSVTFIGDRTFLNCKFLETVKVSNNLVHIGSETFKKCTKLVSIKLPRTLSQIGKSTFESCNALIDVTIDVQSSLSKINESLFSFTKISNFVIPMNIESIEDFAFSDCANLASVSFENCAKLTVLGASCFDSCIGLKSIVLPDTLKEIRKYALKDCTKVQLLKIPKSINKIENLAFESAKIQEIHYCGIKHFNNDVFGNGSVTKIYVPIDFTENKIFQNNVSKALDENCNVVVYDHTLSAAISSSFNSSNEYDDGEEEVKRTQAPMILLAGVIAAVIAATIITGIVTYVYVRKHKAGVKTKKHDAKSYDNVKEPNNF